MSANRAPESRAEQNDRPRPEEAGAPEAVQASEIRYRRLFESAKDGILILDAETGMVTDVNPYLLDLLGYSHSEVLQKKVWELGFLKDVVANEGRFAELRQTEYVRYDNLALEGNDGRRHEVEFISNVYLEGSHKVIQCNIRDISERKRSETKIQHLVQVLRAVRNVNQLITSEKDKAALLHRACEILTETHGYDSAWIATVDADGHPLDADESGIGAPFDILREGLLGGQLPACAGRALASGEVIVIGDPKAECGACPLVLGYAGSASLAAALMHGSRNYGVLTVTLPHDCAEVEEERALVMEVAGDLGLALHAIELEAEHRAIEVREAHLKQVLLAIRNVNQLIVHEEDPKGLIAQACGNLTETLGYTNAWVALLDGDGRTVSSTASAGFDGQFDRLSRRLERGEFSACMRQALESDSTLVVNDPPTECTDCPLAHEYEGRAGFIRRLAFEGRTYGILAASVPAALAHDSEEKSLFDEVVDDLGFALHKIELRTRLSEADAGVRAKLNALLAPEGDVGELSLADVLDVPSIQAMMDNFLDLTGIGVAILDAGGKVLVATGWQDICTKFHRVHPEASTHCIESDTELTSGVEPGTFKFYRCKNHLWDVATPIMLGGRHAGNVFFGQLFFAEETPDSEVFRTQARQYGFDEEEYLAAMDRVPRWSKERVRQIMTFYADFARQLSDLSFGNIRLARTLAQRDELLKQLGSNEERLRLALKVTNDVVWDWDIVNDAQRWNETGTAVFGWTDIVEAPQTVAWWLDRIHPEDRPRVDQAFFAAVNDPGADRWSDEYRLRKADGAYAIVADRGYILRDGDGRAVRMIGAMLDITERKRAEEALRESETRFRFLVDYSDDLIWTLNSDGILSYASPSWKTRLGYEPSSIAGKAFQPMVHPDDLAACEDYMASVYKARRALSGPQYRVMHSDGSWRWHEASMTPVYAQDGSFMYFVGVSRDITERKRAQDALLQSEARFRSYIEHAPYGVFVADGQGRYVDVNPAAERITGYSAAQLLSMSIPDLLTAESLEIGLGHFQTLVAEGQAHTESDFRRADDSRGCWSVSAIRIGPDRYLGFVEDITQRKEREERIALLGRMLDDAPAAVTIHDNDGRFLFSNLYNMFLHGYESEKEFLGINLHRLDVPESEALLSERFRRIAEQGEARFEVLHYRMDGSTFPLEVTARAIQWQGRPAVLSIAIDITERKRAEQALRAEHERLENVLSATRMGIDIIDCDFNLHYVDRGWQKVYGDPAGRKCYEYFNGLSAPCPGCGVPEAFETKQAVITEEVLSKEGNRPIEVRSIPFQNAEGQWLVAEVNIDITERRKAEEALKASELRFKNLLQNVPTVAVQGYALDGTVRYWNRASETFYRFSAEEAFGKNLLDLIIPPAVRDGVKAAVRRMVETGETIPAGEVELMRKDGSLIPVYSSHALVQLPGQDPELFCIDIDLTERRHAEAERENLQAQLLQAKKMESIGRLAGGVAHDFNNLLMGIMGYTELCREKVGPDDPIVEWLDEISHEAERSTNLTRQLLAFARKQTIEPRLLDLNDAVAGILKLLRRLIGEDIELVWKPGTGVWPIRFDPGQIDQILANLCVNARDAIGGVGRLTIETVNAVIDREYCAEHAETDPGDYAMLVVSDDGCGMDRETLTHVFEPFFTTKPTGQGAGLGLATVYGIVRQNGGFVNVYSEPGKGSTFRVYLPRCQQTVEPRVVPQDPTTCQGGTETILLVEDEKSVREITELFLKMQGYRVLTAADPKEALGLAGEHPNPIHLLITDVVMPGMNGRDLARKLSETYPLMKCLFISGYTANVIAHQGILEEGLHFLSKPFNRDVLTRKVYEVLKGEQTPIKV